MASAFDDKSQSPEPAALKKVLGKSARRPLRVLRPTERANVEAASRKA